MKIDMDIYGDDCIDALEDDSIDARRTRYFETKETDPCDDYWDDLAE